MVAEGVIQFQPVHTTAPLPSSVDDEVRDVLAWRQLLFQLGGIGQDDARYDAAGFGNVSVRTRPFGRPRGQRAFVVTGTQTGAMPSLSSSDLCWVRRSEPETNRVHSIGETLPSSESMTHAALYDLGGHIRAVVHVHLPGVFSRRRELRLPCTAPSAGYGTVEMVRQVRRLMAHVDVDDALAFAMEGHEDGIVVFGRSLEACGGRLLALMARAERVR